MRDIKYGGGLRMCESILRTPTGRRVLRVEVNGAWTGAERGPQGHVMDYANSWPRQAEFVVLNLKAATACGEGVVAACSHLREEVLPLGGDLVVSEAPEAVGGGFALHGVTCVAGDTDALAMFDRTSGASHDAATAQLPPGEGWSRSVPAGTCEFRESIVLSPEGRRVLRVVPQGNCAGSDWIAGRQAREHLESLAELTPLVVLDLAEAPTWADAATAAAWVLRTRLRAKAGDCVIAGAHPAVKRSTIPFQWKLSPDLAAALVRIDKGE
ncbi:MAG: hypothetical protein IT452_17465 [Planctomycetia bacterium]|nr:hypothetical protein [Planctomycetia bacterium]